MAIKYTLLRDATDLDKDAKSPQVKCILRAMGEVGSTVTREELVKALEADSELVTRQEPAKLVNFYAPKLINAGIISKEKEVAEKPEPKEKAEKPASTKGKGGKKKGEATSAEADADVPADEAAAA